MHDAPARTSRWPSLTLEQYASLCVDLRSEPERRAETCARYSVQDDAQQQALDRHWSQRFEADPALRVRWERACGYYAAWRTGRRDR
jgi:hypothetical protein